VSPLVVAIGDPIESVPMPPSGDSETAGAGAPPPVARPAAAPALKIHNLSKEFPGTRALDKVGLDVTQGEIHALCGGNGSGKSTLIKILCGVYHGEPGGEIECGGVSGQADHMTPSIAHQMGVRVVHQDLGVFPDLTVAENMSLGSGFELGRMGRIKWRKVRARSRDLIERFEIPATPRMLMRDLSRAAQTQVAIARALQDQDSERAGILILDEPTASLPVHEVDLLLSSLRRYAAEGQSILYVSHRLDEIMSLTDRVSVLRDGVKTGTWTTRDLTEEVLIELIIGRQVGRVFPEMPPVTDTSPALEIEDLWAGPLRGVNLTVAKGEVVGIAGLLGSGRSEILHSVFGSLPITRGTIRLDGKPSNITRPQSAMDAGVALVPENRAADAAFLDQSVYTNMSASVIGKYWRGMLMRERTMRRDGNALAIEYGVKTASVSSPLNTLSGGNQQKVIMARWLRREPRLLLLDEPTQGVDVGARADIYSVIRNAVANGAAAVIVASDFEELAHVVDRAIVLREGRVVAEVAPADLTAHRLIELSYAQDAAPA
jgi:ribose transport system ATP-binding protein